MSPGDLHHRSAKSELGFEAVFLVKVPIAETERRQFVLKFSVLKSGVVSASRKTSQYFTELKM